jgi:large subunit ribosomal protein L2
MKRFKATTPGRRGMTMEEHAEVTRTTPEKSLTVALKSKGGRNNLGRLTVRYRGGGAKQRYRIIDFNGRGKIGVAGVVKEIEYDPNRNVPIALVEYPGGERRYVLLPQKVRVGFKLITATKAVAQPGNRMFLKSIPEGVSIHNIELRPGQGGRVIRTAGTAGVLMSLDGQYAQVRMPSGETRLFHKECMATVGVLANADHANLKLGKAGRSRHRGIRPHVRGKAMNPVDHPHGGGEGKNPIGLKNPKTPWGKCARGLHTRHRKSTNRWILVSRHKAKGNR